ncbi:MAG: DUF2914 domain-containing protein [Gammaproteobacteria bacterium]
MSPLSDEYLSSLEPETLRYDVTIFDDFVISVLPNGIKTWAFLYDYEGRKRRKTLGVYPDMSYEEAEDALDNSRAMILKLGDDIKDSPVEPDVRTVEIPKEAMVATPPPAPPPELRPAVLATRTRKRYHTRPHKMGGGGKRYFALGLLCVLALGAAIVILPRLGGGGTATSAAPAEEKIPGRAQPKPIVIESEPEPAKPRPGRMAPKPIILDDTPAPAPPPVTTPSPVESEPLAATEVLPAEPVRTVSAPADPLPTPEPEPIQAQEPEPVVVAAAPTPPASAEPERVAAVSAPSEPAITAPVTTTPVETEATSTGGNVTRSIVTSDVADLEPVDNLGANITLTNGGYQTVFYFTELRNFTAGNIVHRWTYNGRVIADVPLRVNGGWRWRTYSSKDLLPGMTGDWSVSVVDGDGRVLGEQKFRFDR